MEIHGDEQSAKKNTSGIIRGEKYKTEDACGSKQYPVSARDKYQYPLLNFHLGNVQLSLKIFVLFL